MITMRTNYKGLDLCCYAGIFGFFWGGRFEAK